MAAYIRQLIDEAKRKMYPVTTAKAVYINTTDTVDRMLNDLVNTNADIIFKSNEIIQTKSNGKVTTKFLGNTITETTVDDNGRTIQEKTTTINNDGTIKIRTKELGTWDMTTDITSDNVS